MNNHRKTKTEKEKMKKIVYSNLDLLFEKLGRLNEEERKLKDDQDFVLVNISRLKESGGFNNKKREK